MRQELKNSINNFLRPLGLKLEGLASDKEKTRGLDLLVNKGHFTKPVFQTPRQFLNVDVEMVLTEIGKHYERYESFRNASSNAMSYTYENNYFSSPDAEILYAFVRKFQPDRIIEVGSGNSTKISRMAIIDGGLKTDLTSIDPYPRTEIDELTDCVIRSKLEDVESHEIFLELQANDILFIDSSHIVAPGNDVVELFCQIVPQLASGVLVHIHDVFLPWEYPEEWLVNYGWDMSEQYLVHALLYFEDRYEVIWPGYYLQQTHPDFQSSFPHINNGRAQSLWLRIK